MSVRPIRSPLVAVVGDHEACLTISSALLRLGQVLGRPVGVKPRMSLVGIDGRTLGSSWRPILADLRSSPDAPARRCTEERDALLRLLECERGLLVAVVVSALGALPDALSGHSAPVHEVVVRGKEDDPANVALSLSRVLLGEERAEVLDHIPARLRPGHRLGLAAVFWDPFRKWDVKRLAEAAGSEARALGRDFAQAALPDPERVCDLFRIAGALSLLEPGKGSAEKLAWRYGFSGAGRIEERCRSLTGFGPQELLAQGASPSELLDVAERLAVGGQQGSCSSARGGGATTP